MQAHIRDMCQHLVVRRWHAWRIRSRQGYAQQPPGLPLIYLVLTLASPGLAGEKAAPPGPSPVVVYHPKCKKELEAMSVRLAETLVSRLGQSPKYKAVSEEEIRLLASHGKDLSNLLEEERSQEVLSRLSTLVEARNVIYGNLGRIGELYVLTLTLTDVEQAAVVGREGCSAEDEEALLREGAAALARLMQLDDGHKAVEEYKFRYSPGDTKIAVTNLAPHGVTPEVTASLTQILAAEVKARFHGLDTLTGDDVKKVLEHQKLKSTLQCTDDTSCLIKVGKALGVRYLLAGSAGKLGDNYVLSLKLIAISRMKVRRTVESYLGTETELPRALRHTMFKLMGIEPFGAGRLAIKTNVDEGKQVVDGKREFELPLKEPVTDLPTGKHGIVLSSEGFFSNYQEGFVEDMSTTTLYVDLNEKPRPWYKKWWPWTIMGSAVVAGVVTTVVLMKEPTTGSLQITLEPPTGGP